MCCAIPETTAFSPLVLCVNALTTTHGAVISEMSQPQQMMHGAMGSAFVDVNARARALKKKDKRAGYFSIARLVFEVCHWQPQLPFSDRMQCYDRNSSTPQVMLLGGPLGAIKVDQGCQTPSM